MSLAVWHLLILWMTLASCPRMSAARSPYVSEFEYVPQLHPSRNPDCPSQFVDRERIYEESENWDRPSIEIRAVLPRCSGFRKKTFRDDFHVRRKRRYDEKRDRETIRDDNCTRKILISMRFNNIGKTEIEEKFVVIDHAFDSVTMRKIPLRNPYVIKVRQEAILQLYGLKFQSTYQRNSRQDLADSRIDRAALDKVVNAEAREEVINNRSPNYTGCDVDSERPTCGQAFVHGELVPFSQGFCCSCDPKVNGGSNGSSTKASGAKSNYQADNNAADKGRNRLRASSEDNSVAQIQAKGAERARSGKKSDALHEHANLSDNARCNAVVPEARRTTNERSSNESCVAKETEANLERFHESRESEASNFGGTKLVGRERYRGEHSEASSLSAEVAAGRTPDGDKAAANDVLGTKSGRLWAGKRWNPKHVRPTTRVKNSGSSRGVDDKGNQWRDGEGTNSNREFHSIGSKAEARKLSRAEQEKSSKNPFVNHRERNANHVRVDSSRDESKKKSLSAETRWREVNAVNGRACEGAGCKKLRAESFYGASKSPAPKSGKRRRDKVFPVRSTVVDSPAIRPSMHLNEPLKNSSTGVLNSNGSPARWTARTSGIGQSNLNRVMGNTSPSRETFNEKHGRAGEPGYFQSHANEKYEGSSFGSDMSLKPISAKGKSVVSRPDDFSTKRANKHRPSVAAAIKNYTPQKRTLKDFSCRDDYDMHAFAGRRKLKEQDDAGYGSETNSRRSASGQLRDWKNSRSPRSADDSSDGRGRRKRSKKAADDKEPSARARGKPGHEVRVYIDSARSPKGRTDDESMLGKLARDSIDDERPEITNRKGEGTNDDSISWDKGNRQDSVDKQIEEKFSRISDALKEDTMTGPKRIVEERNRETSEKEKALSNVGEERERIKGADEDTPRQIVDGFDKKVPGYQQTDEDDSPRGNKFHVNGDSCPSSQDEKSEEEFLVANPENNPSANNPDEFLNNYTPTFSSQLVISPPIDLSVIEKQNRVTSNVFAADSDDDVQSFDSVNSVLFTTDASDSTRALIVVDLFKIAKTGSPHTEPLRSATPKEIHESTTQSPGFIDRLSGLKKNLEKAFQRLRPANRTLAITESTTIALNESTTTNTTNATSTTEGTTKITDKMFRPLIKGSPDANATRTSPGGAEFHEEIGIEEETFPDETKPPITAVALPERLVELQESIFRDKIASSKVTEARKREKKSTTASTIEKRQNSAALREHEADRLDENRDDCDGRERSTPRAEFDSAMKFSLEAADVNVVREKLGAISGSVSREQRNYVQVRVDEPGIRGSRMRTKARRKRPRIGQVKEEPETANENRDSVFYSEIPVKDTRERIKWINHPWFVTTETFEYTVHGQMDKYDRVPPSDSSSPSGKKTKSEARRNLATNGAPGRILPPCAKNRHRRVGDHGTKNVICETETNGGGRRLLSVQRLPKQNGKNELAGQRSDKEDRKKISGEDGEDSFVKGDGSDLEYEEEGDVSERRKRLKSIRDKDREKSKKRDAALKRKKKKKKKKKNDDKEQSAITSQDSPSEDYDYLAGEQTNDEDGGNDLEGSVDGNYDYSDPALPGLLEKETNDGSKISNDVAADDNSYDRSSDNSIVPIDKFDRYRGDPRNENQVSDGSADEEEKSGNTDLGESEDGKDFEISLTGKIHLESDSYGRPVSISFNAEPEFFRKDFIDDGKANSRGNRFPLESADSFIDASDTLVSAGTDNANFLPDVFDVKPSGANAPLDQVDDRSVAREYFLDTIRARNRNAGRYRNELDPRQKLLRLQKKPIEISENPAKKDSKQSSRVDKDWDRSLRRSKKDSESSNLADESEKFADADRDESLNAVGQNRADSSSPNKDDLIKTSDELPGNSPRGSLDLSNLPRNNFDSEQAVEAVASAEKEACLAMNITTLRMELIGITTIADKFQAPVTTTPLLSIHDLKLGDPSNVAQSSGTEVEKTTTSSTPATTTPPPLGTTTIISSLNETVVEAKISYPKPDLAIALATTETTTTTVATTTIKITSTNETVVEAKMSYPKPKLGVETAIQGLPNLSASAEGSNESIERRNMLAISEFVKKLEKLVADTGNSSNATGRTLIHLKKFIIVPDNRTFWSLREFSAPESRQETGTTETVVVMGEGTRIKDSGGGKSSEDDDDDDDDESEYSAVRENSRGEERNLIKEIIDSIIGGDGREREALSKRSDKRNDRESSSHAQYRDLKNRADALPTQEETEKGSLWSSEEREFRTNLQVGKNAADLAKASSRNSGKIVDEQFLDSSLETPIKDSDVCAGKNKSSAKGKREAAVVDARSASQKREREGKKKDAKHSKKKHRRKWKKKTKKGKGNRDKKNSKKAKSKWPFKRNLLMLSEEEQIQPSNVDYGIKWRDRDKFLTKEEGRKNTESARKLLGENGSKEEPQIRGGQDCSDRRHPPNVDPLKYLESAHCLRFSDLWYSVYQLEEPVLLHKVHLQIYAKRAKTSGSILWKDLTNGTIVRLGTFDKYYRNRENTVIVAYDDVRSASSIEYSLNPRRDRLLVPSTLSGKRSKYSEAEGWSSEYLVVQTDKINEDANECDKAGVGFTAFAGQPDRCERVSGTCLKNQPLDYWRHDIEARESGRAGCYFLSNFARVPNEAIKYNVNGTGSREFLALEYHSLHVSVIDVELRDDYNNLHRAGSSARLTEVHTDNTAIDYTVITLLITNKGSSSSSYRARITDCPKGVPVSWLNAESPTKTISPHRDRKVALNLNGRVSLNEFSCSVVLLNRNDEPAAQREIKVRKMDRCFCVGHCECSCLSDSRDEEHCQPMSKEHYQAAGFQRPLLIKRVEPTTWPDAVTIVCLVLLTLLLFLLLLGFLKWIIGICVPVVSRWGLDGLLETRKMTKYLERDLKSRNVVFNQYGQPVHPDTGRKSVRICCRVAEFFLNLTFFFIYPFGMLCVSCKEPRCSCQPNNSGQSKANLVSEKKGDTRTMICVSTYGDGVDSKMEAEDTKYVIDELKKSQESLQNYNRYKVDVDKSLLSKDVQTDSVVFRGGKS